MYEIEIQDSDSKTFGFWESDGFHGFEPNAPETAENYSYNEAVKLAKQAKAALKVFGAPPISYPLKVVINQVELEPSEEV